jgi:hypothetical protein
MHTKIKINKYILLTVIITLVCAAIESNTQSTIGISIVYIATMINHYLLVLMTHKLIASNKSSKFYNYKLIFIIISKFMIIIGAFYLAVHFMGNRVIIPVINYVVQIFILGFCLKKRGRV